MWRRSAAVGVIVALGVTGVQLNGSADTATWDMKTLSKQELKKSGLRIGDVPSNLYDKKPKRDLFYAKGAKASAPDLCVKGDGETRYGKQPKSYAKSLIGLEEKLENLTFTETNSDIYQYKNTKKAYKAYKGIQRIAKKCVSKVKYKFDEDGASGTILIKGTTSKQSSFNGVRGFSLAFDLDLNIDVSTTLDLSFLADQYAVYHLSGKSIVRVEYADVSAANENAVTPAIRSYVKETSETVAARTWRRATAGLG